MNQNDTLRVLFSSLLPAVRLANTALIELKEMKRLIELAYYHEARNRKLKLKEICDLLSVSMSKAGLLSKQLKAHFSRPELEQEVSRRILALLWAGPLSEVRINQALEEVEPEEVHEALNKLLTTHAVVQENGAVVTRFRLSDNHYRLYQDHWFAKIDGLNTFLRSVSMLIEARFFRHDDRAFARTLSFRTNESGLERLRALYEEQVFPLVLELDGAVGEDDASIPMNLSLHWVIDGED